MGKIEKISEGKVRISELANGSTLRQSSVQASLGQAETYAKSAYEKASGMKYRWAEGDAGHLLGEIYSGMIGSPTEEQVSSNRGSSLRYEGLKRETKEWIKKAVKCRKEILDPKVKESEAILERIG